LTSKSDERITSVSSMSFNTVLFIPGRLKEFEPVDHALRPLLETLDDSSRAIDA
jgi:hypothetical protein